MEPLLLETKKQTSIDTKNESIEQAVQSPSKIPTKVSGTINSNARYA